MEDASWRVLHNGKGRGGKRDLLYSFISRPCLVPVDTYSSP